MPRIPAWVSAGAPAVSLRPAHVCSGNPSLPLAPQTPLASLLRFLSLPLSPCLLGTTERGPIFLHTSQRLCFQTQSNFLSIGLSFNSSCDFRQVTPLHSGGEMSQNWQLVTRGSVGPRGPDSGWLSFSHSFGVHLSIHKDKALMGTMGPMAGLLCKSPVHLPSPLPSFPGWI